MTTKTEALLSLKPGAEWTMKDGVLKWLDSKQTEPTESEINAEIARLDTQYTNNKYQRDREAAYDTVRNQLDQLYWDKKNGTNKWVEAIDKVKSDNPKP